MGTCCRPARSCIGVCSASALPLLLPHPHPAVGDEAALASVIELLPSSKLLDAADLAKTDEPALLPGAWPPATRGWSWARLREQFGASTLVDVVLTPEHHYMPSDTRAVLRPLLQYEAPYTSRNMSAARVLDMLEATEAMQQRTAGGASSSRAFWRSGGGSAALGGRRLVWHGPLPALLRAELEPHAASLYASAFDHREGLQGMWFSSPGMRTHTHFDSDRNFFVQLLGEKRFVIWPPNQTARLCPFPRLHPLWHKSRVDFEAPDLRIPPCAGYALSKAIGITVRPGDVLFMPPFYWHTVETLSPSLSLSTISRWPQLYNHLNALYTHEYLFDALHHHPARVYALRAFLVRLVEKAAAPRLIEGLVEQYAGLEHLFREAPNATAAAARAQCVLDARGTPTCRWCLSRINLDVTLAWEEHLIKLPAPVRAIVLPEFIEEITAEALGATASLPFWRDCFGAQPFFLTQRGTAEHNWLWDVR